MEQPKDSVKDGGVTYSFTARDYKPGDLNLHPEMETYVDPETGKVSTFSKESLENLLRAINGT